MNFLPEIHGRFQALKISACCMWPHHLGPQEGCEISDILLFVNACIEMSVL